MSKDWREQIRTKLFKLYGRDKENMGKFVTLLMFFNAEVDKENQSAHHLSTFAQTLKLALEKGNDAMFKEYSDRMMNDAVEFLKNPQFYAEMERIYKELREPNSSENKESALLLVENLDKSNCAKSGVLGLCTGLAVALKSIPAMQVREILQAVRTVATKYGTDYRALNCVDEVVSTFNKTGGTVVMVGLAAVFLTWEVFNNMNRWWNGEISGKRCAKNCIDSMSQIAVGAGGGYAGAAIGTMVLPGVGTVIGGMVGGLLSGYLAKVLSDAITRNIFDLPKEEALENAFKFLGVHHTTSNNEINKNFHRFCLKYHPDKGGRAEDFHLLQVHMTTIKLARESFIDARGRPEDFDDLKARVKTFERTKDSREIKHEASINAFAANVGGENQITKMLEIIVTELASIKHSQLTKANDDENALVRATEGTQRTNDTRSPVQQQERTRNANPTNNRRMNANDNNVQQRNENDRQSQIQCHYCQRRGHRIRDCRNKQRDEKDGRYQQQGRYQNRNYQPNYQQNHYQGNRQQQNYQRPQYQQNNYQNGQPQQNYQGQNNPTGRRPVVQLQGNQGQGTKGWQDLNSFQEDSCQFKSSTKQHDI